MSTSRNSSVASDARTLSVQHLQPPSAVGSSRRRAHSLGPRNPPDVQPPSVFVLPDTYKPSEQRRPRSTSPRPPLPVQPPVQQVLRAATPVDTASDSEDTTGEKLREPRPQANGVRTSRRPPPIKQTKERYRKLTLSGKEFPRYDEGFPAFRPLEWTNGPGPELFPMPPTDPRSSRASLMSEAPEEYMKKPICSLNLICYRPGSQGCVLRQVRVIARERFDDEKEYDKAVGDDPHIIKTDQEFFEEMRREYNEHMCSFWRRHFSLKTLRHIRLLSYTPTTRPEIVPLDDFTLQEVFHAYNNPATVATMDSWITWVFRLRQRDRRHALEFVEGWSGARIAMIGSVPWVAATVVGVAWTVRGGDAQTAFTVAGFILTVGTALLALLAIVSKIES